MMTSQVYYIGEHPGKSANLSNSRSMAPESLTARFDRLMADLELKNSEVEQFVRTVSQDLKSPLLTIKGFLTLLRRDAATGDRELIFDDIRQIGRATDRLLRLLDKVGETLK